MDFMLERFRTAHDRDYETALKEIEAGRKESHWMWYIFPQLEGLGHSAEASYFAIRSMKEAVAYWEDPVLSTNLWVISKELLKLKKPIEEIMGYPDYLKLKSSMTLFHLATDNEVFREVLDKFFGGKLCEYTVNKLPRYYINDTGMKIINILEDQELAFCEDTTGKDMVLCRYMNKSDKTLYITISGTLLRYRIPKGSKFYCVCCEDAFGQTFRMIQFCGNNEIAIRTGTHCCILTDEYARYWEDGQEPICDGVLRLGYDGKVTVLAVDGHHYPIPGNRPVVYVNDNIGIDSKGFLFRSEEYCHRYPVNYPLISACQGGELCITSDRRVLCRGELTLEKADPAIAIASCTCGYLVQTKSAVYFSDGQRWHLIGTSATAIAASGYLVAFADEKGNAYIYKDDKNSLVCAAVVKNPGRHIEEMDISDQFVVLKFGGGSFDVINWHTGKTALGDVFISPDIPY